jgi:hypothetical protein
MRRSLHGRFPVGAADEVAAICGYDGVLRRVCEASPTEGNATGAFRPGGDLSLELNAATRRTKTLRSAVA